MKAPQDEQPTNGVAHLKENTGGSIMELFINCQKINLYQDFAEQITFNLGLSQELISRHGNCSKTIITLDPLSPTFITDYFTFIKKR